MDKFRGNGDASEIGLTSNRGGEENEGEKRVEWLAHGYDTYGVEWKEREGKAALPSMCSRARQSRAHVT